MINNHCPSAGPCSSAKQFLLSGSSYLGPRQFWYSSARVRRAGAPVAAQNPRSGSKAFVDSPPRRKEPLEVVSRIAACVEMNVRPSTQLAFATLTFTFFGAYMTVLTRAFLARFAHDCSLDPQAAVSRFETLAGRSAMVRPVFSFWLPLPCLLRGCGLRNGSAGLKLSVTTVGWCSGGRSVRSTGLNK